MNHSDKSLCNFRLIDRLDNHVKEGYRDLPQRRKRGLYYHCGRINSHSFNQFLNYVRINIFTLNTKHVP